MKAKVSCVNPVSSPESDLKAAGKSEPTKLHVIGENTHLVDPKL